MQLYERQDTEERGRHLVAAQDIEKGQIVLTERPLLALQSLDNIRYNQNCHCCLAFVGGPDSALCRRFGREYQDPSIIACRHNCGQVFCSKECEADAWNGFHKHLCTGEKEEDDPLVKFKQFAVETNEILLLVAEWWVAQHTTSNPEPYTDFTMNPWWDILTADLRKQPGGFTEAFGLQKDLEQMCTDAAELMNQFLVEFPKITALDIAKRIGACEQNAMGIRQRSPLCREIFDRDLRERRHQEIIEALAEADFIGDGEEDEDSEAEATNDNDNPKLPETNVDTENGNKRAEEWDYSYDEIAGFLANLFIDEDGSVIDLATPDAPDRDNVGDDLDYLFLPLDGTAMYSRICKMNHSCDPSIAVMYKRLEFGSKCPLVAHAIAQRDIKKGEELTISYIESKAPYKERQAALESYGFSCECTRCQREREGIAEEVKEKKVDQEIVDNVFGSDDEAEDETLTDELHDATSDRDEEELLQSKLQKLDTLANGSRMGTIPLSVLSKLKAFVIQIPNIESTMDKLSSNLFAQCKAAVQETDYCMCEIVGAELEDHLYKHLKSYGSWPSAFYREAYWCSALCLAIGLAHRRSFLSAMQNLDKGMILGLPRNIPMIKDFVERVEYYAQGEIFGPYFSCSIAVAHNFDDLAVESRTDTVSVVDSTISSDEFLEKLVKVSKPANLKGFASTWPAASKWIDLRWWCANHGHRLVPIEIGSMTAGNMEERLLSIRQFVNDHLLSRPASLSLRDALDQSSSAAYLAQHPLLDQIPSLLDDTDAHPAILGSHEIVLMNCWMGTAGTRTPLHYDAYDNLLVQIVGWKYVRLYDRVHTEKLYVSKDSSYGLQGNMSELDCENEDFERHPAAKDLPYQEVLLKPGDCLFIPSKCWHYVRSLTTSISVNYWF